MVMLSCNLRGFEEIFKYILFDIVFHFGLLNYLALIEISSQVCSVDALRNIVCGEMMENVEVRGTSEVGILTS